MLRHLAIAVAIGFAPVTLPAVTLIGGPDCGQWFDDSRRPNAKIWLAGYLSGLNSAIGNQASDPLDRLGSMDQAYLWIDKYCRDNPLKEVQEGGNILYNELRKKRR